MLCLPSPPDSVMKSIFGSILQGFIKADEHFSQDVSKLVNPIVESTVELFESIKAELLPTPAKSHYTFNLRDISKIFQGCFRIYFFNLEIVRNLCALTFKQKTNLI